MCLQLLLEHGADVNKADSLGCSPLLWACMQGNEESCTKTLFLKCKLLYIVNLCCFGFFPFMSYFYKLIPALVPELIFVDMLGRKAGTEVATRTERVESVDRVWTRPLAPHIVKLWTKYVPTQFLI
jgi:ankyrin repeat protein